MKKKLITLLILCLTFSIALFALSACNEDAIYKVTFNNQGSTTVVEVVEGGKAQKPQDPIKAGYEFDGWYLGNEEYSFDSTVSGDITVEAKFTAISYAITYNLNGGTVETANPATYTIETETFTLNNPIKANYEFAGWVEGENLATLTATVTKGTTGNKTFTATYVATVYNITYDYDLGIASNPTTYTVEDEVVLKAPIKLGYNFTGWTWEGQTEPVKNVTIEVGSSGNKAYKANYELANVALTYDLDGGTVTTANPETISILTETFTLNNPTRLGSTFVGWTWDGQTEPVLNVTIEKGSLLLPRTFVANYAVETYDITYELNGGIVNPANPVTYTVETATFTLNNPTKQDYVFTGWTWDSQTTPVKTVTIERGSRVDDIAFTANFEAIFTVDENGIIDTINDKALELTVLNIPAKVGEVDVMGVSNEVLKKVTNVVEFTTTHTALSVVDGNLYMGNTLLKYAPNKTETSFTIPSTVTAIGDYAFANATNLTEVIIDEQVVAVGEDVFNGTTNIVVKVEAVSYDNFDNDWAKSAKKVIVDYKTGDNDDIIVGGDDF